MMYKVQDVYRILDNIAKEYDLSNTAYVCDTTSSLEQNIVMMVEQNITKHVVMELLQQIKDELQHIEQIDASDYALDVPTKCENCFARRDNGVCWVCAFTGDISESGFFAKYNVMEHCPFLIQKYIDDLAYDIIREKTNMIYQEIVDDLDNNWRETIRHNIRRSLDRFCGDGNSD